MSYQIYHTEGIVVGITNRGEANRVLTIMTRDLGLVRASAQSIRKNESKLRSSVQQLSHCHCDFILGKEYWRLIGVESIQTGSDLVLYPEIWSAWNRCAVLLDRLIPVDEVHTELYDMLYDAYIFSCTYAETLNVKALEHFLALRILAHLGYWSFEDDKDTAILLEPLSKEVFDEKQDFFCLYTKEINEAIKSSDL